MLKEEQINEVSMEIILKAGNAREALQKGMKKLESFDFDNAEKEFTQAESYLKKAHQAQTEVVQGEARGEDIRFSLLFAHAQDTLMTIMSEKNIFSNLLKLSKSIDKRISELEEK